MKVKKIVLALMVSVSFGVNAQLSLYSTSSLSLIRSKIDSSAVSLGSSLNAIGMIAGTNLAVWGFDRYATHSEFANISLSTVRANFRKGFVWDNDYFSTNLFMHPYHGGLYFNAARTNGMNFWQSMPYAVGGSLMWELFMEKEYPSINDLIATSIGGFGLGEVTFRLSDRIIDERSYGLSRLGREFGTFLISPERGLNRLVSGRMWKHASSKGNVLPPMPLNGYASVGYRSLFDDAKHHDDVSSMAVLKAEFSYGNPYDEDNDKPYDYFSTQINANLTSKQPFISKVKVIGMLYSERIPLKRGKQELSWGIYQHFNYLESRSDSNHVTLYPYKMSETASIGPGLLYRSTFGKHHKFYASAYLSGILLGSSQSDHYNVYKRDYNLGSGFSTKLNMEWMLNDRFSIRFNSEDYRIYTWMGYDPNNSNVTGSTQGDRSRASLSIATLNLEYLVNKHFFFGLESGYNYRLTDYKHYPTVKHGVSDNNFCVGWLF